MGHAKRYCIVDGCRNNDKNVNLSFFALPVDNELCEQWLKLVGREDLLEKENVNKNSQRVCSNHFENSSIRMTKRFLRADALPTLFLPNQLQQNDSDCNTNISPSEEQTQTSKSFIEHSRKRKLAYELRKCKIKKQRLEKEIHKLKTELKKLSKQP